jgi:acetyl-CoA carboxylase carboxyltransferase component
LQPLKTQINPGSNDFRDRAKFHGTLINTYKSKLKEVTSGGPEPARQKHTARGKLLVRDRINLLLDPNTPFLELSPMAAYDQYNNEFPAAGIITGIGTIHGKEVVVIANDATVKGGTYIEETIKKHLRAQEIAYKNNLPAIYLVDSGGVFLPNQADVFPDKDDFGRIFYNQARLSSAGIPQVAVVMGSCTAGGAYVPAMSDETIIVRDQGTIFLGGPPLVRAATGEVVTAEELGGGHVHTSISGVADHLAADDRDALQICRNIFETIQVPEKQHLERIPTKDPLYSPAEIPGILPSSSREPYDVREIIARLVDGSEFSEFKKEYGKTLVTGFAHIMGYPVGIIANNGVLF